MSVITNHNPLTADGDIKAVLDQGTKSPSQIAQDVKVEDTPSKPVELKANTNAFARSIWTGFQSACISYTLGSVCNSFLRPYSSINWVPLSILLGSGFAFREYARLGNLNSQVDKLKDESFKPGTEIQTSTGSNSLDWLKKSGSRLGNAAWAGWRAASASYLTAGLAGNFFGFGPSQFILNACALIGTGTGISNLIRKQPENLTHKPEGRVQTAVKSVFKGFVDSATLLISGMNLVKLLNCHGASRCQRELGFLTASASIAIWGAYMLIDGMKWAIENKAEFDSMSSLNRFKCWCRSAGKGVLVAAVPIGVYLTTNVANPLLNEKFLVSILATLGLSSAIETYYSRRNEIKPELSARKRFLETLPGAVKTYSFVLGSGLFAIERLHFNLLQPDSIFILSAALGTAQAVASFFNFAPEKVLSKAYQKWKSISRVKKLGLAMTSIAALGVMYLGGPSKTYEFGNDKYEQVAKSISKMYYQLAYDNKSD